MRGFPLPPDTRPGPAFGPIPKHSPPAEPHVGDPFDSLGRRNYRGVLDAVGDGFYSDDGTGSVPDLRERDGAPRSLSRGNGLRSDSRARNDAKQLSSQSSHAALRETHVRHRPALDEHGNPAGVDLEQRKAQIVRRWSKRISMSETNDPVESRQPRSETIAERSHSRHDDELSVSPARPNRSPTMSPSFVGGASLATVPSFSSASSARPESTSSGGSASVRTPTDQHTRSGGHQHHGSETTLRPAKQEKTRRVMVGMSPYGVPIYREVAQDEPDIVAGFAGVSTSGKKEKDKGASGKSEGGGLGWLLSPQAKAEKAAAKVQAKMEKRAREVAEREEALAKEAERRKLKEEMQERISKIRAGGSDTQAAKELARIDAYQFAFMGNM